MHVQVWELVVGEYGTPLDRKVGEIGLEADGRYDLRPTAHDDREVLASIVSIPVFANGREIDPAEEPEEFLRSMHLQYRSPYLRVGPAKE